MRIEKIKDLLKKKTYFKISLIGAALYLVLSTYLIYYFFNGFYLFFNNKLWYYPWLNILFGAITSFLFGINLALAIKKFKELKEYSNQAGTGVFGLFTSGLSLFSAGCPVCSLSILSLIVPSLGLTFSLVLLPFKGLEIQLFGILILLGSIFVLTKREVCKVKNKNF
ncbi:hypothetical protein HYX16_06640 [Candidatus Woesearchaeota archaeon]|nr:hypothetical protein [Candidatus Woesearchaeota archaeon]